jgi:hypothetical protein
LFFLTHCCNYSLNDREQCCVYRDGKHFQRE